MVRVERGVKAVAASKGQALVLALLLAGAAALASLVLFNSGMLANTKTQLQNAADAGAYSGAVMLARDHNFAAYTNRAIVANQVAVAQLVSLKSYLEDAASTRSRMNGKVQSYQANIPTFNMGWTVAKGIPIQTVNNVYANTIARPAVEFVDLVIRAMEKAQQAHHQATAANVMFIVDEVVQKNDPHAAVSKGAFAARTAAQTLAWRDKYTRQHNANDTSAAANRFANVVVHQETTDKFIRDRASIPTPAWIGVPKQSFCPGGKPIFTNWNFDHRGGTILSTDKKRWLALDATEGDGIAVCIYIIFDVPVPYWDDFEDPSTSHGSGGSGGAVAGRGGPYNDQIGFGDQGKARRYGNALNEVRTPAMVRYRKLGPGNTLDSAGGLQKTYRDVADFGLPLNQSPELNGGQVPLTVEVEREQGTVRTSSSFLGGAANIRVDPQMKAAKMRTLSSAHAFFYRPKQNSSAFTKSGWKRSLDNKAEMANLFNPYWQARLRDHTAAEWGVSFEAQR